MKHSLSGNATRNSAPRHAHVHVEYVRGHLAAALGNDISSCCRRVERVGDAGEQAPTAGDQFTGRGLESLALVGDAVLVGVAALFAGDVEGIGHAVGVAVVVTDSRVVGR